MDLKGKVVVITGATSGLGQATAIDFASRGAKVILTGRDTARGNETLAQIKAKGGDAELILGDVSTKAGMNAVAQAILAKTQRIDVLLNNAGGRFEAMTQTADGIETTFALNAVGSYVLERQLHPAIAAAKGRVVNVVTGFLNSFKVKPDQLKAPPKFSSFGIYGIAKHAMVMMSIEQAKRYEAEGVKVVSVHPGVIMGTRFGGGQPAFVQAIGGPLMRAIGFMCTLEEAVRRFGVACFDDVPSGSYMVNGKVAALPKQSTDAPLRGQVVTVLDQLAA